MIKAFLDFWRDELGATMIDYILVAAIVGVAAFVAMDSIGSSVVEFFGVTDEGLRAALDSVGDDTGNDNSGGDDNKGGDDGGGGNQDDDDDDDD